MGVFLTPIIEKHVVSLEAFRGRTIAVDGNLELYQFLSVIRLRDGTPLTDERGRVTSHLNGLMFRTTRLVADYDIRPIFVFDGVPPPLKAREIEKRRAAREKATREHELALQGGDYGTAWSKAVMSSRLTREMVAEAKVLLGHLGIPCVQAPSEGEAQAASLAREGVAWAASSKDYDSLLFGAPRLVRFLTISGTEWLPSKGRARRLEPEIIELEPWLRQLGISRDQLIDAAILVGTDFNDGVRGVGPKTAVRMIRDAGGLEGLPKEMRERLPPNVEEIRGFFRSPPVEVAPRIEHGRVDPAAITRFLVDERSFSAERVRVALERLEDRASRAQTSLGDERWR